MRVDPDQPELRQDPVTGDWIALASKRGNRPRQLRKAERRIRAPKEGCPFEDLYPHSLLREFSDKKNRKWDVISVPNKFPIFTHSETCAVIDNYGPYSYTSGVGDHEVVITRDHHKNFPMLTPKSAYRVFDVFLRRYKTLAEDKCIHYCFIFHNWGSKAGASIYHPHYQILGWPVVPPDVQRSLDGSAKYFSRNKRCVHCDMIKWEREQKDRVVFENSHAIVFAPYASRFPFEVRLFLKRHSPYFEDATPAELKAISALLQKTLKAMKTKLQDPDYNFYIHTAPIRNRERYKHYHWHIEVLPKTSVLAAVEIGTGIDINIMHPGRAAAILRGKKSF